MADITDLNGRVALVTGGAKNIGKKVAEKFAKAGASVGITYQQGEKAARATCEEFQAEGLKVVPIQIELTEKASIDRGIAELVGQFGPIDIVVNNAAIRPPENMSEITTELWDLVMNTNARGPFQICQNVMPSMIERGFGRFIFHGGVHASFGARNSALGASKLAGVGIMRSLSALGVPHGITSNVIVPGFVNTHHDNEKLYGPDSHRGARGNPKGLPIGRMSEPDDIANLCLFLASPGAAYISGQEIFVSGGIPPFTGF